MFQAILAGLFGKEIGDFIADTTTAAATVVGTTAFIEFIFEESIQAAGMGTWALIDNRKFDEAEEQLQVQEQLVDALDAFLNKPIASYIPEDFNFIRSALNLPLLGPFDFMDWMTNMVLEALGLGPGGQLSPSALSVLEKISFGDLCPFTKAAFNAFVKGSRSNIKAMREVIKSGGVRFPYEKKKHIWDMRE